jgi:hypothetical protein
MFHYKQKIWLQFRDNYWDGGQESGNSCGFSALGYHLLPFEIVGALGLKIVQSEYLAIRFDFQELIEDHELFRNVANAAKNECLHLAVDPRFWGAAACTARLHQRHIL